MRAPNSNRRPAQSIFLHRPHLYPTHWTAPAATGLLPAGFPRGAEHALDARMSVSDTWPGRTRLSLRLDVQNSIFSSVQRTAQPALAAAALLPTPPPPATRHPPIEQIQRSQEADDVLSAARPAASSSDAAVLAVACTEVPFPLSPHANHSFAERSPRIGMVLEDIVEDEIDVAQASQDIVSGANTSLRASRVGSLPGTPVSDLFDEASPGRRMSSISPIDACNTSTSSDSSARSSQSLLSAPLSTPSSTASSGSHSLSATSAFSTDSRSPALQTPRTFAFESADTDPSFGSPPTARKLAFGDIAPAQTAVVVAPEPSELRATTFEVPTLVRGLSDANSIANRAIEEEEWNTLLESAAVYLQVNYMVDQQWLHELCDNSWFQIICMFFFIALSGAIGIGACSISDVLICSRLKSCAHSSRAFLFDFAQVPRTLSLGRWRAPWS
jgi:hypothetical protein